SESSLPSICSLKWRPTTESSKLWQQGDNLRLCLHFADLLQVSPVRHRGKWKCSQCHFENIYSCFRCIICNNLRQLPVINRVAKVQMKRKALNCRCSLSSDSGHFSLEPTAVPTNTTSSNRQSGAMKSSHSFDVTNCQATEDATGVHEGATSQALLY